MLKITSVQWRWGRVVQIEARWQNILFSGYGSGKYEDIITIELITKTEMHHFSNYFQSSNTCQAKRKGRTAYCYKPKRHIKVDSTVINTYHCPLSLFSGVLMGSISMCCHIFIVVEAARSIDIKLSVTEPLHKIPICFALKSYNRCNLATDFIGGKMTKKYLFCLKF